MTLIGSGYPPRPTMEPYSVRMQINQTMMSDMRTMNEKLKKKQG